MAVNSIVLKQLCLIQQNMYLFFQNINYFKHKINMEQILCALLITLKIMYIV